jgi:hypothetical protein
MAKKVMGGIIKIFDPVYVCFATRPPGQRTISAQIVKKCA